MAAPSGWPVGQCTQDQLVADIEGVREALGLGRVHVLGISWGGFLCAHGRRPLPGLVARARRGGRRRERRLHAAGRGQRPCVRRTPAQWTAYRALWDGSARRRRGSGRAFDTIRPLYFFDKRLATDGVAGARRHALPAGRPPVRHRARVPALRLPGGAAPRRRSDPGRGRAARLDLPRRPGRGDPPAGPRLEARRVRAERPLPARGRARSVHAGELLAAHLPVQRTAFSDW